MPEDYVKNATTTTFFGDLRVQSGPALDLLKDLKSIKIDEPQTPQLRKNPVCLCVDLFFTKSMFQHEGFLIPQLSACLITDVKEAMFFCHKPHQRGLTDF